MTYHDLALDVEHAGRVATAIKEMVEVCGFNAAAYVALSTVEKLAPDELTSAPPSDEARRERDRFQGEVDGC